MVPFHFLAYTVHVPSQRFLLSAGIERSQEFQDRNVSVLAGDSAQVPDGCGAGQTGDERVQLEDDKVGGKMAGLLGSESCDHGAKPS